MAEKKPKVLGREVSDRVTGFAGVATSYVISITGEDRVEITPKVTREGYQEPQWFDVGRLSPWIGDVS